MSAASAQISLEVSRAAAMPARQVIKAYLAEARYECIRALRTPSFAIPFLVIPVALYLFFGVLLFRGVHEPVVRRAVFTAFAVIGVMGPGIFGFGIIVAAEREQRLLTLKRALPAPPGSYLIAKMVMAVLFSVLVMALMIVAAVGIARIDITAVQYLAVTLVSMAGVLPFCAIGLFIGTRTSAKSAPAFANLAYLPMIYLSGLIPLPASVSWISYGSPAYYLDQLARKAVGVPTAVSASLAIALLAGVTLLAGVSAVRRLARVG